MNHCKVIVPKLREKFFFLFMFYTNKQQTANQHHETAFSGKTHLLSSLHTLSTFMCGRNILRKEAAQSLRQSWCLSNRSKDSVTSSQQQIKKNNPKDIRPASPVERNPVSVRENTQGIMDLDMILTMSTFLNALSTYSKQQFSLTQSLSEVRREWADSCELTGRQQQATVSKITTHYNQGMQKSMPEHTLPYSR